MNSESPEILKRVTVVYDFLTSFSWLESAGFIAACYVLLKVLRSILGFLEKFFESSPKKVVVGLSEEAVTDVLTNFPKFDPKLLEGEQHKVYKWDPSNLDYFGEISVTTKDEVDQVVARAREAQKKWKTSSFKTVRIFPAH
jgi:hypothetical protein